MIESLIDTHFIPLGLLLLFGLTWLIQLGYYWLLFWRLARYRAKSPGTRETGVSVVICAHNECHHLRDALPLILEQDYPEFEVLVVNHASDDDTVFLLSELEKQYPHLKQITIQEDLNFFSGKKFPLSIGIRSACYDKVLLTDADCRPASRTWIREMVAGFRPGVELVLGYGAYNKKPGLLNKLIRFDTVHIAIQYLSYALAGIPYMGVGRNLSYLKQLFIRNKGFISHYRIRSGDDDLFVNRVAGRSNTMIALTPGSFTFSEPKATFGKWITQKRRHFSTSIHYRFVHRVLLGTYSFSLLVYYTLFILLLSLTISPVPVLGLFVLRLITQFIITARCMKRLEEKDLVPWIPLFDIMLLLMNTGLVLSNVFSKPPRWK